MPAPSPTSLVDVVDERDRPIGATERRRLLSEGHAFRVVHVWVVSRGRLLLQQLGKRRDRHPLRWGSSVAAYLHSGETYFDAAKRRLREEIDLELQLTRLGLTRMQDGKSTKFITLYLARTPRPDLPEVREPAHIEALRYWSRGEIARSLRASPEVFTETFRHLYALYTSQVGEAALH